MEPRARPIIAVPVGSCEQHGPHLPLDTDTRIAIALAEGLVSSFEPGDVLIGPTLTATSSGEHAGFPGTLSIGAEIVEQMIVELVRSADWSAGVVLVNGHGGNARPVHAPSTNSSAKAAACWRGGHTFATAMPTPANPRRR